MKKNKNKVVSLTLAGAVAVTALLAGTYAWRSISQEATNEARNTLNPGARLHDDFNGMSTTANDGKLKNVYVENFTETANGANVFARIRLDEYLEIGVGAGKASTDPDKNVDVIAPTGATPTPNIDDKSTWTTYKWDDYNSGNGSVFRGYVDIKLGSDSASGVATATGTNYGTQGKIYYMPTYNKNKDSLEAEINGTLAGPDGDKDTDIDAYKDYVAYASGSTEWGIEIYDADEEAQGVLPADEIVANGLTAEGIIESVMDPTTGKFTTAALDLTSGAEKVTFTKEDGTTVQYEITKIESTVTNPTAADIDAIEVSILGGTNTGDAVANIRLQVVNTTTKHTAKETQETAKVITMAQWKTLNNSDKTGNFWVVDTEDGWAYWAAPIEPGKATGRLISSISTIANGGAANLANKEYYYGLNVVAQFATAGDWGTDTGDKDHSTGFYGEGITSDALTLLNTISGMTSMNDVQTAKASLKVATAGSTVQIDGVTYIVAVQNATDSKALLVAQDVLKDDTSNAITKTYDEAETYLNGTFLGSKKVLNSLAIAEGTRAKVFMLSEDDVVSTGSGNDYTDGSTQLSNLGTVTTAYWLRTVDGTNTDNAKTEASGTVSSTAKTDAKALRPAVWVNYATAAQ